MALMKPLFPLTTLSSSWGIQSTPAGATIRTSSRPRCDAIAELYAKVALFMESNKRQLYGMSGLIVAGLISRREEMQCEEIWLEL